MDIKEAIFGIEGDPNNIGFWDKYKTHLEAFTDKYGHITPDILRKTLQYFEKGDRQNYPKQEQWIARAAGGSSLVLLFAEIAQTATSMEERNDAEKIDDMLYDYGARKIDPSHPARGRAQMNENLKPLLARS